nr:hypothetical protein [Mimivirus sp.]
MIIIFSYRTVARIINEYIQNIIWYFGTKNIDVKFHVWTNRQEVEDYIHDNNISNCVVIYVKDYVIKFSDSLNIQEIILNTEQLLTLSYRRPSINFVLGANCPVIDYSEINMDIIKKIVQKQNVIISHIYIILLNQYTVFRGHLIVMLL